MCVASYLHMFFIVQNQTNTKELAESIVLQEFYEDLQNGLPINELLPQLVTNRVITIKDKILITECGKTANEISQYFLDKYIIKPLSTGDPSPFYKLLEIMDKSPKCAMIGAKIKQCLNVVSLQDKISGK